MPIHDHFDGSMHCVECGGKCRLSGDALTATELARWLLESRARGPSQRAWLNLSEQGTLKRAGVDVDRFCQRATEAERAGR